MLTVEVLKLLYVEMGGEATDQYDDIAGGIPVAEYSRIPDCISACAAIAAQTGGYRIVMSFKNGKYVLHKTWKEIQANKYKNMYIEHGSTRYTLVELGTDYAIFTAFVPDFDSDSGIMYYVHITDSGATIDVGEKTYIPEE